MKPLTFGSDVTAMVRTSEGMRPVTLTAKGRLILPLDVETEFAYWTLMGEPEKCRLKAIDDAWAKIVADRMLERRDLKKALPRTFQERADALFALRYRRATNSNYYHGLGDYHHRPACFGWRDRFAQHPASSPYTKANAQLPATRFKYRHDAALQLIFRASRHYAKGFGSQIGFAKQFDYNAYYNDMVRVTRESKKISRPDGREQWLWKYTLSLPPLAWYRDVFRHGLALIDGHMVIEILSRGGDTPMVVKAMRGWETRARDTQPSQSGTFFPMRIEKALVVDGHLQWPDGSVSSYGRAPAPADDPAPLGIAYARMKAKEAADAAALAAATAEFTAKLTNKA